MAATAVAPDAAELVDAEASADASVVEASRADARAESADGSDAAADPFEDGSCSSRLMCSR